VRAGWRGNAERTQSPIIVNSSRAVIYADSSPDFAKAARDEALKTRDMLQAQRLLAA
jgi:orotidine-5'-phosphate decarboxylase